LPLADPSPKVTLGKLFMGLGMLSLLRGIFAPLFSIPDNLEWEWCSTGRDEPSVSGGMITTRWKMRRRVNGRWEYRPLTPEEEQEYIEKLAW